MSATDLGFYDEEENGRGGGACACAGAQSDSLEPSLHESLGRVEATSGSNHCCCASTLTNTASPLVGEQSGYNFQLEAPSRPDGLVDEDLFEDLYRIAVDGSGVQSQSQPQGTSTTIAGAGAGATVGTTFTEEADALDAFSQIFTDATAPAADWSSPSIQHTPMDPEFVWVDSTVGLTSPSTSTSTVAAGSARTVLPKPTTAADAPVRTAATSETSSERPQDVGASAAPQPSIAASMVFPVQVTAPALTQTMTVTIQPPLINLQPQPSQEQFQVQQLQQYLLLLQQQSAFLSTLQQQQQQQLQIAFQPSLLPQQIMPKQVTSIPQSQAPVAPVCEPQASTGHLARDFQQQHHDVATVTSALISNPLGKPPISLGLQQQQQSCPLTSSSAAHQPAAAATTIVEAPLRALSAYNFFFRDERERILSKDKITRENDWSKERQTMLLEKHWKRDRSIKRRHRKSHGKISFADLSKQISQRWKELPDFPEKEFYRKVAAQDWERYHAELSQYKLYKMTTSTTPLSVGTRISG